MAITKAINKQTKSHAAMRNCIEYVLRDSKIKDGLVDITGPYPFDDITYDLVYKAFREEKAIWNKDNGRMYAHHVISFHKDEAITPEQAFEFGKVFAEKVFGSHQTLISVHQDKNHLHIHFVTNSVSFLDGYKLHISAKELEQMKLITNDMCRERGLTVAEKGKHFDGTPIEAGTITSWSKDKYNMIQNATKESFLVGCMTAIKEALETACDKLEFIQKMKEKGWEIKWKDGRKNITFIDADGNKVRDATLSKTFNVDVSKASLEKQFGINAEREGYYKSVEDEIGTANKSGTEKRASVMARLQANKEIVKAQKAEDHKQKKIISNRNRGR